jgi:VWFA-related protein
MRRAAIFLIFSLGSLTAQNRPFRVQTKVVQVPVRVTDKNAHNIDGLTAHDFSVLDDGIRQEITVDDFGSGLPPISLAIAIQTSGISTPALARVRRIGNMIQPLVTGEHGEAAVIAFGSKIAWLQDFTPHEDKVSAAVKNLKPEPGVDAARMLDAIAEVVDRMKGRKGRKILLLISESGDRGSNTEFPKILEAVEREGIEVFGAHYSAYTTAFTSKPKDLPDLTAPPTTAIDPAEEYDGSPGVNILGILFELARLGKTNAIHALTKATGGSDYPWAKESGIENAIQQLGVEVHSQYLLSFRQPENATGMHRMDVSVPDRSGLRIRSRGFYWADTASDPR